MLRLWIAVAAIIGIVTMSGCGWLPASRSRVADVEERVGSTEALESRFDDFSEKTKESLEGHEKQILDLSGSLENVSEQAEALDEELEQQKDKTDRSLEEFSGRLEDVRRDLEQSVAELGDLREVNRKIYGQMATSTGDLIQTLKEVGEVLDKGTDTLNKESGSE